VVQDIFGEISGGVLSCESSNRAIQLSQHSRAQQSASTGNRDRAEQEFSLPQLMASSAGLTGLHRMRGTHVEELLAPAYLINSRKLSGTGRRMP